MDMLGALPGASARAKNIVVLSPHSDDAALSLGGLLLLAAARGHSCTIVTAFSRSRRTRTGGIESSEERVTAMRRREDEAFIRMLGDEAVALWCDLPDPSVRLPGTRDTWYVPSPFSAEERGFASSIARFCEEHVSDADVLLAPMGLGNNRDHLIARDAALEFFRREPRSLFLYEDLPYVARMSGRHLRRAVADLADAEALTLTPHRISYAALMLRKRRAVAAYASQVNWDITNRVLGYALRVGNFMSGSERVWEAESRSVSILEREPVEVAMGSRTRGGGG